MLLKSSVASSYVAPLPMNKYSLGLDLHHLTTSSIILIFVCQFHTIFSLPLCCFYTLFKAFYSPFMFAPIFHYHLYITHVPLHKSFQLLPSIHHVTSMEDLSHKAYILKELDNDVIRIHLKYYKEQ